MKNTSLRICTVCNHISAAKKRGSGGVEFVLWFFYLIPGLIYHLWRNGGTTCPACNSSSTIPVNTPKAQEIITSATSNQPALHAALQKAEADVAQREKSQKATDIFIYGLIILTVIVFTWTILQAP